MRIDMYDKRQALVDIIKLLMGSDAVQPSRVAVTQVNIGAIDALEAAKRVSFLLAAARAREADRPTIEALTMQASSETAAKPSP